jgi:radical SAM protein with 4Fe4S-binding SPASM domain
MKKRVASSIPIEQHGLWNRIKEKRIPFTFDLEVTARCNNNCRHCYISLPANDREAQKKEISPALISDIADQAVALGALWCLLTGGEPLLRGDFEEIYMTLKRKGLLVSLYTNACLLTDAHVAMFKKHPPRIIEVTVYGATEETYERVSRCPGSYAAFRRGLDRLVRAGIPVRLKAMTMRSNIQELPAIAAFCRQYTKDFFRFDPLLFLRLDGDPLRNSQIQSERLTAEEIVAIEHADEERSDAMKQNCEQFIFLEKDHGECRHLFHCGAGRNGFTISAEGYFHLCSSLRHPGCTVDLRRITLAEAWKIFTPKILDMTSSDPDFLGKCRGCRIINLCLWCPANAHLETGRLDGWSEYFCRVAHARADALRDALRKESEPARQI